MIGREKKEHNDLFFVCSLIEYIARKVRSHRNAVANSLGKNNLEHIFSLADVYHSENIEKIAEEYIEKCGIKNGNFDNVAACKYEVPTFWDIGKVYKYLIISVADYEKIDFISALIKVYNSFVSQKIENFNSSMYYENTSYIFACYCEGKML